MDDGSTDGTADAVRHAFDSVTVIRGDGSLYWAAAMARAERVAATHDARCLVVAQRRRDTFAGSAHMLVRDESCHESAFCRGWLSSR